MDRLRAREVYADGMARIIAIESVRCSARKFAGLCQLNASIELAALVVCMAGRSQLFGLAKVDASLEELEQEVHGLRALLAGNEA